MANWSPLSHRPLVPGELRLPWGDETFSSRMLAQHLDEAHDRASRRPAIIDSHIPWLLQQLAVEPTEARILDLGCGPGLYLERLTAGASIGAGVDIAPAAIAWAEQRAGERGLDLSYHLADMLTVDLTGPFDLILDLYGDLSTFDLPSMTLVMERIARWLRPRGRAVIELSTRAGVRQLADLDLPWYPSGPGLFSDTDHLILREARWFEEESATAERWWVVDGHVAEARVCGTTTWWHGPGLDAAISAAGLEVMASYGDLTGAPHDPEAPMEVLVLERQDRPVSGG